MRATGRVLAFAATLAVLAAAPARGQDGDDKLTLDAVNFGTQVSGPPLSPRDLTGHVTLLYQWCVSCPMSTGAFPFVNDLVARYGPRGLAVVGFQVRREPEVEENDVVWFVDHLKPAFPIVRLGWVCEWPVQWLPWGVLFDHEGKELFRGHLDGIGPMIERALDAAPDFIFGGPYTELAGIAARIAADRSRAGRYLAEVRAAAGAAAPDPKSERTWMLGSARAYFDRQVRKAEKDVDGPVEQAKVLADLAALFSGDELGREAESKLAAIRSAPSFPAEETAWTALTEARAAFRRLPPPGGYIYHPTDMIYQDSDNPVLIAQRGRMIAEYRMALARVEREWPGTYAAGFAGDLLYERPALPIPTEAAKERFDRATALGSPGAKPADLLEACLLLHEAAGEDAEPPVVAPAALASLARLEAEKASEIATAAAALRALTAEADAVIDEIEAGGSGLPREQAAEHTRHLEDIGRRAGAGSGLARRLADYAAALEKSYAGPAYLGVGFDPGYEGPGARIAQVSEGSCAARHGLKPGDLLLALGGREIGSAEDLRAAIGAWRAGQEVEIRIQRASPAGAPPAAPETIRVVLGRRL